MLIGGKREEQIEGEFFWFEVFEPLVGSQSMINPREVLWNFANASWDDGYEWFFKRHGRFSNLLLLMSDVGDITSCMENRLAAFDGTQNLKKLESLQLAKPSDLYPLYLPIRFRQSTMFAGITETEVDSMKNIQQINKFRWKEDSKIPSFTTQYQPLI